MKMTPRTAGFFSIIARALKPGGRHFMDIMNADYADRHFPRKLWDAGEKCLTLSNFEWNANTRTFLYGQTDIPYNVPLPKPDMQEGNPIRLYSRKEIEQIFAKNGMSVLESFADFGGTPPSENGMQLMVLSQKIFQTDARRSADPKIGFVLRPFYLLWRCLVPHILRETPCFVRESLATECGSCAII